jgi:hypothetical protein
MRAGSARKKYFLPDDKMFKELAYDAIDDRFG